MEDTTKIITATEFKTNLGQYLDYVAADNDIVITKNGSKSVRLTPYISKIEQYFTVKERAQDYVYGGKKVSYTEFMEIYENSEQRMEYINGEIVLLASPSTFHQDISGNLHIQLRAYLKGKKCKVFFAPFDVHFYKKDLDTPDVMQPDLIIVCDHDETINERDRYMGTPSLCIEILSNSTRSKDMIDKLNTFMLSGVKEFWIVDPVQLTVLVYSFENCKMKEYAAYRASEVVRSFFFEGLEITVDDIFAK